MEKDDILFQKRIRELAARSYDKGIFTFTEFLDLAGQDLFYQMEQELRYAGITVYGEEFLDRKVIRFGKAEELGYEEDFPISCICIEPVMEKFSENLSHRDYLGALMSLGIERANLGDILIKEKKAFIFCLDRIVPYLLEHITQIRHTNVKCSIVSEEIEYLRPQKERQAVLCPSERIDVVIAKLYHFSRSQSMELFRTKKIFINSRLCENNSYQLKKEDIISVRGYGKFQYQGISHETKKGKISVLIDVYV